MLSFVEQFKHYISTHGLFKKTDKLLVAISGGCDSVALTHILLKLEYRLSLAHCNFGLRGKDSDEDELFVKEIANRNHCELFIKRFETIQYASENKLSVEEAARNLRYHWFEELRKNNGFDCIVTAHHLDDAIETFFINITAGTGIRGLCGIPKKNNYIVRPFLFTDRKSIQEYCRVSMIEYRTDQSNFDTKFVRNRIRHTIIPEFKSINPSFNETMNGNIEKFSELYLIYQKYMHDAVKKVTLTSNKLIYIDFESILTYEAPVSLLYEITSPYGFNSSQIKEMVITGTKMQTGTMFLSKGFRIIKHGNQFILGPVAEKEEPILIYPKEIGPEATGGLVFNYIDYPQSIDFSNKNHAYIDAEKLSYPLQIRQAVNGDYFFPYGMKGKKKISDYFTDLKLSLFEKENTKLLISGGKIVWVIGRRIDERFKIDPTSKKILYVKKD